MKKRELLWISRSSLGGTTTLTLLVLVIIISAIMNERDSLDDIRKCNVIQTPILESSIVNDGSCGITKSILDSVDWSLISSNLGDSDDADFHFDTFIWFDGEMLTDDEGNEYTRLTQRKVSIKNRNIQPLTKDDIFCIVNYVFTTAGDLSFETQVVLTSVIFNKLEADGSTYGDLQNILQPVRYAYIGSIYDDEFYNQHSSEIEDTKAAIESVINNDPNVIHVPQDVCYYDTGEYLSESDYTPWESDCVDGLYFYK